jgi:arabinose-5-phosphate isomerase
MSRKNITDAARIIENAKETFLIEGDAVCRLCDLLTEDFVKAVQTLLQCRSHVAVSGMGKSGLIGKKIAATLASTGTPAFFIHPAEALHGDFGMLTAGDVLVAISSSGETEEMLRLIPLVKAMKIPLIALAGRSESTLARQSDFFLNVSVPKEACPLQLAPTASTTAALAMGDALAIALMREKKFTPGDFALRHPGGSLGKKLLTHVGDVMCRERLPIVTPDSNFKEVISVISQGMRGIAIVIEDGFIRGAITDGDIRRAINTYNGESLEKTAVELMTTHPITVKEDMMLVDAERLMQEHKIVSLLVVSPEDDQQLVGIIQRYALEI